MPHAKSSPHFRTPDGKRRVAQELYRGVYAGAPMPFLLMTPEFQIIDANEAYLTATMRHRDSVAGRDLFEAFPDNPACLEANAVANLRKSLMKALSTGSRQAMPLQRYDVTDPRGNWRVRYWQPVNWPVLDKNGSVLALVHHVTDVTSDTLMAQTLRSTDFLFKRAEAAWDESRRLREETRRRLELMIRALPRRL